MTFAKERSDHIGMEEKGCLCCGNGNVVLPRHYKNGGMGPQRISQDDVTLQSHSLISRKRSRVGIGRQARREKRKEGTRQ